MSKTISAFARPAMPHKAALLLTCLTGLAPAAGAEVLSTTSPSIRNSLCVGQDCATSETFSTVRNELKLKGLNTGILFDDTSDGAPFPTNDWAIEANDTFSNGDDQLMIIDVTGATEIVTIKAGAPAASLVVASSGHVGLGTEMPMADLHIASQGAIQSVLRLEADPTERWDFGVDNIGFFLREVDGGYAFVVDTGAPSGALSIDGDGQVGIGTDNPTAPLELFSDNSFNYFRITADGAAVNDSVDITFTGGPLGTGQLRYNIVDGDAQEMSLDADGNMVLDGTLTTGGPSCAGGCDAVFIEGQIIPERDYSAQMWADGHLPHVGPTAPGETFNVTEKVGGMLNALEHAHIYIERQRAEMAQMKADHAAQIAALTARLEALENQ